MHVLISGAGIAGPTLAYWLSHYGIEATLVEKAPKLRTGGYIIDFWGAGFDIADRMGLLHEMRRRGYSVQEIRVVNRQGKKIAGFPTEALTRVTQGRFVSIPRGDLAELIFREIDGHVETIFGDGVAEIRQTGRGTRVRFVHAPEREFDLVVGADGLHSQVRELIFGKESRFEKYLGYKVAAFEVEGYRPRDELVYVMYTELHQQIARFAMRGDRTMFLFTFADENPEIGDLQAQKSLLRRRFGNSGWECPQILDILDRTGDLYFDRISQIRMDGGTGLWASGRTTLVGDAAWCVSLLAGQGSALAMVGSYILAGELFRAKGDHARAFAQYQHRFASFILKKQNAALGFAGAFAPKSRIGMFLRNRLMNCFTIPFVASIVFSRGIADKIALPAY
jgi:2-polyprenyl-6-methoxyphenol hydroxylase-like FAD-dependent oxidoreductase